MRLVDRRPTNASTSPGVGGSPVKPEGDSADQRRPVGGLCWPSSPAAFQACQHESIDVVPDGRVVGEFRGSGLLRLGERPELQRLGVVDLLLLTSLDHFVPRVGRALPDPGLEVGDHRPGQLAAWRHFESVVLQRLQQQALGRLARQHGRTRFTAAGDRLAVVESQSAAEDLCRSPSGSCSTA